ncbi:hypothetical protein CN404_15935 [Bacillus thuringiensis]|uniref:YopX family protein n=1 Tax=Bacillus thuringiensis TaxID=1428 RepID=UPI000BFA92D4|nr:YopX family protein [Bacillus thuringiensis]PFB53248.1 hypothetical protein CN404_15935 [Bacillus thuringiensis]
MRYQFRVWNLMSKKMMGWGEIFDLPAWEIFPETPEQRAFNVMQYTGSKDKNGRELYELDITKDKFGNIDVVCWINSLGAYATVPINLYVEGNYEYTVVDEFGTDCFFKNNVPGDFLEVIGNIYENPELLEESK